MYPLHFGHFAGMLSRIVWGALGVALCFVTLSGLRLWVRRRADVPLWAGFGRSVDVVAYGLPLAMLASAYGNFLTLPAGDPFFWTPWSFVIGVGGGDRAGARHARPGAAGGAVYKWMLGVACLGLPLLRLAVGGMSWADALIYRQADVITVDLLLVAGGLWLWRSAREPARRQAGAMSVEPGE